MAPSPRLPNTCFHCSGASPVARIILVDDDPVVGNLLVGALIDAGHAVGWISDAKSALNVMRSRPPDLALLDCAMPDMSGVDLLRAMRCDGRLCAVPAIMLTARTSTRDEALAYGAGASDYLRKPVDLDLLIGTIDAIIPTHATATALRFGIPRTMC